MRKRLSAMIVTLLAVASMAAAQGTTTGSLSGTLTDASGAVLPGVTVTLSGPSLQGQRTVVTDEQGFYRFHNVPPGPDYTVTATLSGFRDATQSEHPRVSRPGGRDQPHACLPAA